MDIIELKQTKKKIVASEAMLEDSTFNQVSLNRVRMDDIAMIDARIVNANLTNLKIEEAQLGGASFTILACQLKATPLMTLINNNVALSFGIATCRLAS